MPGQPRLRLGVAEQGVDLLDGALFVAGGLPDLPHPLAQPLHGLQLGVVVVTPAGPAEAVQIGVQLRELTELLTVHPIGVDQHTCALQCELGVMTENHLTPDLLLPYCHEQQSFYS